MPAQPHKDFRNKSNHKTSHHPSQSVTPRAVFSAPTAINTAFHLTRLLCELWQCQGHAQERSWGNCETDTTTIRRATKVSWRIKTKGCQFASFFFPYSLIMLAFCGVGRGVLIRAAESCEVWKRIWVGLDGLRYPLPFSPSLLNVEWLSLHATTQRERVDPSRQAKHCMEMAL
ncbi:hypothetical protein VTK26DRAFT_7014 [Humicola hyalothermophila]